MIACHEVLVGNALPNRAVLIQHFTDRLSWYCQCTRIHDERYDLVLYLYLFCVLRATYSVTIAEHWGNSQWKEVFLAY